MVLKYLFPAAGELLFVFQKTLVPVLDALGRGADVDAPGLGGLADHGHGAKRAALADGHTGKDGTAGADENVFAQGDGQIFLVSEGFGNGGVVKAGTGEIVAGGIKGAAGGDAGKGADGDAGLAGVKLAVGADVHMVADGDLAVQNGEIVDEDMAADGDLFRGINAAGAADEDLTAQTLEADFLKFPVGVIRVQFHNRIIPFRKAVYMLHGLVIKRNCFLKKSGSKWILTRSCESYSYSSI